MRLRPRNEEEMVADADFAECVELLPEVFFRTKLFECASDLYVTFFPS